MNNFISPPPVSSVTAEVFTIKTEKNTEISEECITTGISDGRETNIKIKTEKETERIIEQISAAQGAVVNIKTESESEKVEQVVSEPTATVSCELLPSGQIKKEPAAKRPLFGAANGGPASKRPSQAKDPNDPWFAAYEAKRQEALNNMKQGNLKNFTRLRAFSPVCCRAGLWIRINFIRIRIQSLMLETNTDPGL